MFDRKWTYLIGTGALLLYIALTAVNLYWGDVNQDEGWYLYAARLVHDGNMPYRDFAFTQGPVLPYVYSLAHSWIDRWGVAGGRLYSVLLGFVGLVGCVWLAIRCAPARYRAAAGLLAFLLVTGNVYQVYFMTVVKTYSLCALFLVWGFLLLSYSKTRAGWAVAFFAGVLFALSAGTRISAGAVLPVAGLYLLWRRKELGDLPWLAFGVGGALALAAESLPFLAVAPEGFRFGLFEYHASRSAGGLFSFIVYKAGFISRFVQAYFVATGMILALIFLRAFHPSPGRSDLTAKGIPGRFLAAIWIAGLAITLVHLSAPFPYEDYQVFIVPLFAAALACAIVFAVGRLVSDESAVKWINWVLVTLFIVSTAASFSSPVNQSWMILGRDRIWWRVKDEPALQKLHRVGKWIAEQAGPDRLLLTQDTYLAVESGLQVPRGLEMGPFSYFPDLPRERAEAVKVVNREMLKELLESAPASVAALSGYSLAIRSPGIVQLSEEDRKELWDLVNRRYEGIRTVPDFGQAATRLVILKRRGDVEP